MHGRLPEIYPHAPATMDATLGGGCFWCLDAVYRQVTGVTASVCGYAGGQTQSPDYRSVCGGATGHAEVVQLTFDPDVIAFAELLDIFFSIHDPTTVDRQGADLGPQHRSIILADNGDQMDEANAAKARMQSAWEAPIVTSIERLERFWPAEDMHQDYFARNPDQGYCQAVVAPKVAKFRTGWAHRLRA